MTRRRPVDLVAVRAARARLDALVREHPELVGADGDGVQGWMTTLERDEQMADTEQVAFRLPKDLVKRLDDCVERMAKAQPGMNITRTDAVRVLLMRALGDDEAKTKTSKRARP